MFIMTKDGRQWEELLVPVPSEAHDQLQATGYEEVRRISRPGKRTKVRMRHELVDHPEVPGAKMLKREDV